MTRKLLLTAIAAIILLPAAAAAELPSLGFEANGSFWLLFHEQVENQLIQGGSRDAAVEEASGFNFKQGRLAVMLKSPDERWEALVRLRLEDGEVILTINRHVLMLDRLKEELTSVAAPVEGVRSVATRIGKDFYKPDIYRRMEFEEPSRVLLVDDEREFVRTLSERLEMRDVGSAVAYDGESALKMVEDDEPEVIILDLRMPGIDGIEVLRRVKRSHPHIEVIILTGHGSDEDRATCIELGAFAYLQKPVDIDVLSETLRAANDKARCNRPADPTRGETE